MRSSSQVEEQDLNTLLDNGACEKNLDALATKLVEIQHEQLDSSVIASLSEDYRAARKLLSETLQRLNDFRKNAFDLRTKRDTEAPSRTSALHLINETKKQENALADMAYGQKKQQDEHRHDNDAEHAIFQRRATKPTMLWAARKELADLTEMQPPEKHANAAQPSSEVACELPHNEPTRRRKGMSLKEYILKTRSDGSQP